MLSTHIKIEDIYIVADKLGVPRPTIIAASKTKTAEEINKAIASGFNCFGENYLQEAAQKKPAFKNYPLHMIGHLQSNKAKQAVELFDCIETVDKKKLANTINRAAASTGKKQHIMLQVNIGREPQKHGVHPEELPGLITYCHQLHHLKLTGLMCIPPKSEDPACYFTHMRELQQKHQLPHLSMGMSSDWETALKNGATHIRLGSAIFGPRKKV